MNSVRYSYLPEQFADPEPIFHKIRELLKTGDLTLGREVEEFEERFASLIGSRYAIGVGSGTGAIKLALRALGIGPGDEVITAANTFIATAGAIYETGATPVFVDVNSNFVMDVDKLEAAITPKTKAIVPVHFTGEPVDMDPLMAIAAQYGLWVVEDACQSILAKYKGKNCGTMGFAGCFSFHPLKNLNGWTDGGMIVTEDHELAKTLRLMRNHGLKNRDEVVIMGENNRLSPVQAAVLNHLIPDTEAITAKRRDNAAYYDKSLTQFVDIPRRREGFESCFHLYMFYVEQQQIRDPLLSYLQAMGIEAKVHYPIPLYQQEGLKQFGYKAGDFPITDLQAKTVISLPVDQHLTRDQQNYVINQVCQYFAKYPPHQDWRDRNPLKKPEEIRQW